MRLTDSLNLKTEDITDKHIQDIYIHYLCHISDRIMLEVESNFYMKREGFIQVYKNVQRGHSQQLKEGRQPTDGLRCKSNVTRGGSCGSFTQRIT